MDADSYLYPFVTHRFSLGGKHSENPTDPDFRMVEHRRVVGGPNSNGNPSQRGTVRVHVLFRPLNEREHLA